MDNIKIYVAQIDAIIAYLRLKSDGDYEYWLERAINELEGANETLKNVK